MTTPPEVYRLIPLTQGQFAKVLEPDYAWMNQWKWHAWWNQFTRSFYAVRNIYREDGTRTKLWMHREILSLNFKGNERGDHINHDTLDNRRPNLRIADKFTNQQNRRTNRVRKHCSLKGVTYAAKVDKWYAEISVFSKRIRGEFRATAEEAHSDYCELARIHFGDFACFE